MVYNSVWVMVGTVSISEVLTGAETARGDTDERQRGGHQREAVDPRDGGEGGGNDQKLKADPHVRVALTSPAA